MKAPISVIMCTCDRPDMIVRAAESVLSQTYSEFELLVLDQSRDNRTELLVAPLAAADARLRYLRLKERGLSRAYNRGVAEGRHELLAFTDDDCVAAPGWLAAIGSAFEENQDVGLLYGQVLPPFEPELQGWGADGGIPTLPIERLERLSRRDGFRVFGMGANFAARRSMIVRLGGFDEVLGGGGPLQSAQDFDLTFRVYRDGGTTLLDPRVIVYHYGFRTHEDWRKMYRSYGLGLGGFYWKHVRAGDLYATSLLLRVWLTGLPRLLKRWLGRQSMKADWAFLSHVAAGIWRSHAFAVDRRLRLYRLPDRGA